MSLLLAHMFLARGILVLEHHVSCLAVQFVPWSVFEDRGMALRCPCLSLIMALIRVRCAEIVSIEDFDGVAILVLCSCTKITTMFFNFSVHLLVQKYLRTLHIGVSR